MGVVQMLVAGGCEVFAVLVKLPSASLLRHKLVLGREASRVYDALAMAARPDICICSRIHNIEGSRFRHYLSASIRLLAVKERKILNCPTWCLLAPLSLETLSSMLFASNSRGEHLKLQISMVIFQGFQNSAGRLTMQAFCHWFKF